MRILHLLPSNAMNGAEKVAMLLCKYDERHDVYIASGEKLVPLYRKQGIRAFPVSFSNPIQALFRVRQLVLQHKIQVIHAHDNRASLLALVLKKVARLNIKVVSHVHNAYPWLQTNSFERMVDRLTRNHYDLNILCGEVILNHYDTWTNYLKKERVRILSNGIDVQYLLENREHITKKQLHIEGTFVFGFIGRLTEQKGLVPFLQALQKRKHHFDDCTFLLIGTGEKEGEIRSLLKAYDMEKQVQLLGYQTNPNKYYKVMDAFFLPSLYEGLPMVLLEALTYQKQVVSMDVGSVSEVIHDQKTGYLIPQNDYDAFVQKLYDVKENKDTANELGYELVQNRYCITNKVKELEALYVSSL